MAYGGGGTSSDLPWGRNPDEDDSHFTYRCMMQAHKMLRQQHPNEAWAADGKMPNRPNTLMSLQKHVIKNG